MEHDALIAAFECAACGRVVLVKMTRQPVRDPRRLTLWIALGCTVWCVAGCVSQDVADQANERLNYGMTTAELNLARSVALDRARKEDAKVTATATVSDA